MKKKMNREWIRNPQEGFTLMELLVAMSLLAFVFVIVFQALNLGIRAWEKGNETQAKYQRIRAALSLIMEQISSAYPLRVRDETGGELYLAFEGKENSLEFITSQPLSPQFKGGLSFSTYYLKDDSVSDAKILMASERDILSKGFFAETERAKTKDEEAFELISGISELKFAYYDNKNSDQGWKEEWEGKKQGKLPKSIKIALRLDNGQSDFLDTLVIPIKVGNKLDGLTGPESKAPFRSGSKAGGLPSPFEKP